MSTIVVLASGSEIRKSMLQQTGLSFIVKPARVDEEAVKSALLAEDTAPRDIADALAELKAQKISASFPEALVIGCDQVLDFKSRLLSKAESKAQLAEQLTQLRGETHTLFSAAAIFQQGRPVWRHIGKAQLTMRMFSDQFLNNYLEENWDSVKDSVGGYKLEMGGIRLFSKVTGDYFSILGLPLIELQNYLVLKGVLPQ